MIPLTLVGKIGSATNKPVGVYGAIVYKVEPWPSRSKENPEVIYRVRRNPCLSHYRPFLESTMKTAAVLATCLASAAAFAPTTQQTSSSALNAHPFEKEIGAIAPLGYFDPLGLCKDGNQANFDRMRYTELKHGRVAMLAVVGYLTTLAGVRFPGAEDIPAGFAALPALPVGVWVQMAFTLSMMEAINRDAFGMSEFPGDFRNGALDFGWDKLSEETKLKKRKIELNNGRAAQMGILGLMVHEYMGVSVLPGDVLP